MTVSSVTPTGAGDATAPVGVPTGRREANKRATRAAIQDAADRLIAERGFEATTVREIADAANVTERTFYRYFDGKEGLIVNQATAWMDRLHDAILARPAAEPPLLAVKLAIIDLSRDIDARSRAQIMWLFNEPGGAVELMRRAGVKPLVRFERTIEDAVRKRIDASAGAVVSTATTVAPSAADPLAAELIARISLAVLRTVATQRRGARAGDRRDVSVEALVEWAFATLVAIAPTAAERDAAIARTAAERDAAIARTAAERDAAIARTATERDAAIAPTATEPHAAE